MEKRNTVKRSFMVGESWLYYKIYCGAKSSDIILRDYIHSLVTDLIKKEQIDSWFFIRYNDSGNHIRLRLHITDTNTIGLIITAVKNYLVPLVTNHTINNIEIATYHRELERYGTTTIKFAEMLFYNDSKTIIKALSYSTDEDSLLLFALKNTDSLLDNFGYSVTQKLDFCAEQMQYYKAEYTINKIVNKQLSAKFRHRKKDINTFLRNIATLKGQIKLQKLLTIKSNIDKPIIAKIKKEATSLQINSYLGSYIHMSINRSFRSKQRLYEMLCYDFLVRFYTSEIAKAKYEKHTF